MVSELWYLVKVRERFGVERDEHGEPVGRQPSPLKMHLVLDGDGRVVDLLQIGTLASASVRKKGAPLTYEPPQHLVEIATQLNLWGAGKEEQFWSNWVMYPDIPEDLYDWASTSIRTLVGRSTIVTFNDDALQRESQVMMHFTTASGLAPIMRLEVEECTKQVFTKA